MYTYMLYVKSYLNLEKKNKMFSCINISQERKHSSTNKLKV